MSDTQHHRGDSSEFEPDGPSGTVQSAGDGRRDSDDDGLEVRGSSRRETTAAGEASESYPTNRWRGVSAVALAALAVGTGLTTASLLLVSVAAVAFVVYPRVTSAPDPALELERTVVADSPAPGDEIEIEVTVTNVGDSWLPDLRIVDGVPPTLNVVDGSPRRGASLWPGRSASFRYVLESERGTHTFEPATVVSRSLSGSTERESTVATETAIDCTGRSASGSVRAERLASVGTVRANSGGEGTEFYRTREYRRGDSMRFIDWNRFARTNELTTVEYRQERSATVVLLIDAREISYRGRDGEPHAVAYGVSAAAQLVRSLLRSRNRVGLATVGEDPCWLRPGVGSDHAAAIERTLGTHPSLSSTPPRRGVDLEAQLETLRRRLPRDAQLVLFSPLCDDAVVDATRALEARGHPMTVISPDVTTDGTAGGRLARIERENRASALRKSGVPVVDWEPPAPLETAIAHAREGRR
ncbi:DUF58 domain-containing protein [Natrononativus amylolyticus]|uniref:DUF58 domain-containing protein n=1 Tax=Natrononativus amylolyticus TaxID=2963434 RepID=UPI0020CF7CF2|nr:DUF58 domain-containing protein [Natrononativus amylolyticus]